MSYRKKLIEVSLPLTAINAAASTEKSIRHGHPSTLHLWWARRPLATCRAVLFASLIDDPSEHPERFPTEIAQNTERERLFSLIERMVEWKNIHDANLIQEIQAEIVKATNGNPPPVLDPFAGGGSIPLEAQRLGLAPHASDLNPVAVLINKALIEIPPKFANRAPVNPNRNTLLGNQKSDWKGAHGLADDIRYYGQWMRDQAEQRIGHLYPKAKLPDGSEATVIAWIWARTVKCNNPACGAYMPLIRSFALSIKKGKETWTEPIIDQTTTPPTISFTIKTGQGKHQEGTVSKRGAKCIVCGETSSLNYVRNEAKNGQMGVIPLAIVANGSNARVYLAPDRKHEIIAQSAQPPWKPEELVTTPSHDVDRLPMYGMHTWGDAFTPRQLLALTTFSDLVQEVQQRAFTDAKAAGLPDDDCSLQAGGCGARAYAEAVAVYMAIAVDRLADRNSSICSWDMSRDSTRNTFARQAIPMVWDFAEANPLSDSTGNFLGAIDWVAEVIAEVPCEAAGQVCQRDATAMVNGVAQPLISTDPPYYDNIGYADLSDFFYVWLRRSLGDIYPDLFRTMLVPKQQELVATPYRFEGSKQRAQEFFEHGLAEAFERMRAVQHPAYPLTVYYAFKQAEHEAEQEELGEESNGQGKPKTVVASTGWETMLEGLIRAGFEITGTWPMRTEMMNRSVGQGTNALASSIVLVCRPRPVDAPIATRGDFLRALRKELPEALRKLQHGSIAPVDLAQASIGPGMSIYSRYRQVVESDGSPLRVRLALQMINQELDAALTEQEGDYDNQTRWAIAWFESVGMQEAAYGNAETLFKAKNVSLNTLEKSGLVEAKAGKVRLRRRDELANAGHAHEDIVWDLTQRMIYALQEGQGAMGGEIGAANTLRPALALSESVRDLAYRLYALCERKGWAQEALAYNGLITSWTRITDAAHRQTSVQATTLWS